MTVVYPVIFTQTKDKKDTYLVEIPDLCGMTEGYGIADALHMARDYIGCALYDKKDSDIPDASIIKDVDPLKGRFSGKGESIVSVVDVDIDEYRRKMRDKAVRKNVSLPAWLAAEAEKAHVNLSRVLQDALKEKLNIA
ncbi:MAG: type II toxin-antitoxin system HicB family antitoxin [Lachnospiraceae bacterium]|nr:type II toxin-antitoxin system HicB family antitoxin [Lachnospiraceae bacterium]